MNKLRWHRNGLNFNIILESKHYPVVAKDEDSAEEIEEMIKQAKETGDYEELKDYLSPGKKMEADGLLREHKGRYYLADYNIPIDDKLASHILDFYNKGFEVSGLINFAKLLWLNPLSHVKNDLYDFINKNGIVTTESGHLVLYKSVRSLPEVDHYKLADFVGRCITVALRDKINPSDYCVTKDKHERLRWRPTGQRVFGEEFLGCLDDLYEQLVNTPGAEFTDFFSGKSDIKLFKPVQMDWEECDIDPSHACSKGLHAGSFEYVNHYGGGEDKRILVVIVNPMNITAVPEADKLRTCEYFPVAILEKNEDGTYEEIKGDVWSTDYITREKEQLQELERSIKAEWAEDEDEEEAMEDHTKVIRELLDS